MLEEKFDEHTDGSLADAAACYAANFPIIAEMRGSGPVPVWKWDLNFFNKCRHDRKKQLIISAALLMAEYDRLEREEKKDTRCRGCYSLAGTKPDTWCDLDGMPMNEYDTRCELYNLPPFEASENNPLLMSFMRSSHE